MKYKLTQIDIDQGVRKSPSFCPIALCMNKEIDLGNIENRVYLGSTICLYKKRQISLPSEVSRFIMDFDSGKEVKPFEFEINLDKK